MKNKVKHTIQTIIRFMQEDMFTRFNKIFGIFCDVEGDKGKNC